ncbi:MAG: KpsF/GutQ family sugar-phosphate isomerase [Quisquiliibacterium sp.]
MDASILSTSEQGRRLVERATEVLRVEAGAISALADRIDENFVRACGLILACTGRVVVSGIGKSGHIANKIAATLASTGTPAFFVHPAEASHGDLGMITRDDVLIALSNSGATSELLAIVPLLKRRGAKLIAMTGDPNSALAALADVHLNSAVAREACPLNLAPTASTTAALALGDALAVALLDARGFGPDDFASSHPGGALGRRLLTHVGDVMRTGEALPTVTEDAPMARAILEITRKRMGMTAVLAADGTVTGIFTDGDLRRLLEREGDIRDLPVGQVMTRSPAGIAPTALAAEAAKMMEDRRISQLLVLDERGQLVGALHIHDLLIAKVV